MTIFGPDISNNNGVVDIGQVQADGLQFVFAKVSEGVGFRDGYWPRTRDWCHELSLIVAGYHYVNTDDAQRQADTFVAQLGDATIPAMLDFENGSGDIANFWAVHDAIQGRGVNVALSYIPRWYWQQIGRPDISTVPGLIQSGYGADEPGTVADLYPGDDSASWAGFGGRAVDILQFTQRALIAGQRLDCNAFRSSVDEFRTLLGIDDWQPVYDELMGAS